MPKRTVEVQEGFPTLAGEPVETRLDKLEARVGAVEEAVRNDRERQKRIVAWIKDIERALERLVGDVAPWHMQANCPKCGRRKPSEESACKFCLP